MINGADFLCFTAPIFADGVIPRPNIIDDHGQGREIPKGAHCIASYLQSKGIVSRVVITDSFFASPISVAAELKERLGRLIVEKIEEYQPRFIGFGLMFGFTEKMVLWMTRFTKMHYPEKTVIVGGNQASFSAERILLSSKSGIDIVVRGEGEWATEEIIQGKSWDSIRGISFLTDTGGVYNTPSRSPHSLVDIPPNNFKLLDIDPSVETHHFNYMVQYVRGCGFRCTFCTNEGMWGGFARGLSQATFCSELHHVLGLMERLTPQPPTIFMDDDVMAVPRYRRELFSILRGAKGLYRKASFAVQARVGSIYKDNATTHSFLDEAREVGISAIFLGIETGSQQVMDAMDKKCRVEWVESACRNIKKHGMTAGGFWMFGHPGADMDEERRSRDLLELLLSERILDIVEMHMTIPFPGTKMRNDLRVNILVPEEEEPDHYSIFDGDPIHELVDPLSRTVIMSPEQIREAYQEGLKIKERYLGGPGALVSLGQV